MMLQEDWTGLGEQKTASAELQESSAQNTAAVDWEEEVEEAASGEGARGLSSA
jgi:hypothetical protein